MTVNKNYHEFDKMPLFKAHKHPHQPPAPRRRTEALGQVDVDGVHSPHCLHQVFPAEFDFHRPLWFQDSSSGQRWEKRKERHFQVIGQGETQNGMGQRCLEGMQKKEGEEGDKTKRKKERESILASIYPGPQMHVRLRRAVSVHQQPGTSNAFGSFFQAVTWKLFGKVGEL